MTDYRLVQLFNYGHPEEEIKTIQYGTIKYQDYLEKEKERIASNPERVVEIRTAKMGRYAGMVSLYVNRVGAVRVNHNYTKNHNGTWSTT
jgi:hypothetical protein